MWDIAGYVILSMLAVFVKFSYYVRVKNKDSFEVFILSLLLSFILALTAIWLGSSIPVIGGHVL